MRALTISDSIKRLSQTADACIFVYTDVVSIFISRQTFSAAFAVVSSKVITDKLDAPLRRGGAGAIHNYARIRVYPLSS